MATATLKFIPLDQLHISKLNMRHARAKPDVSDILPSIREKGVRQSLLVRKEGEGFGVVAGRRRYFALHEVAKETGETPLAPCVIMKEGDDASAIEASVIENVGRLPATEMEQYVAFKRLHEEGRGVAEIATFFGVTELLVKRVLALASLAASIRKLYAEDQIDRDTIRALTLATKAQQAEWLRLFESEDEHAPTGRSCRAWITGGETITTDKALFDLDAYDGQVIADLFGEKAVFTDAEAFWRAQSAAVAARIDAYLADGWSDVHCLERGAYFATWDYLAVPKKKGGRVYVEIRHDGAVAFHEGFIPQAEARPKAKAGKDGEDDRPAAVKPEMSGPLADYIFLHRHGAAQASLAGQPAIALRLMVAHAMTGSALWSVKPHEIGNCRADTRASVEAAPAAGELADRRVRVAALFEALGVKLAASRNADARRLCEIFAALLAMADEEVGEVLALVMAETLESGGPVVEAVLHVCETDLSACWKPESVFFDLCRDKRAINAMVADIGSKSLANACRTDTAKVQKTVIANRIAGHGCEANPGWRPGWMQTPPVRLVKGAASPPADAWKRIAGLFDAQKAKTARKGKRPPQTDAA